MLKHCLALSLSLCALQSAVAAQDEPLLAVRFAGLEAVESAWQASLPGHVVAAARERGAVETLELALRRHLAKLSAPLTVVTGQSLQELREIFGGVVEFGLWPASGSAEDPVLTLSLHCPEHGEWLARMLTSLASGRGGVSTDEQGVTTITTPRGPVFMELVGPRLVLSTSAEAAAELRSSAGRLDLSALATESHPGELLAVLADVSGLVELAGESAADVPVETLSLSLVQGSAGLNLAAHLGWSEGAGAAAALEAAMGPVPELEEALHRIPARAHSISVTGLRLGPLADRVASLLEDEGVDWHDLPEYLGDTTERAAFWGTLLEATNLPDLDLVSFAVDPPAGSLIADQLSLVRTQQLEPTWLWFVDVLDVLSVSADSMDVNGTTIHYLSPVGDVDTLTEVLAGEDGQARKQLGVAMATTMATTLGLPTLAYADLGDGWSVAGFQVQEVERYLRSYAGEPSVGADPGRRGQLLQDLGDAVLGQSFTPSGTLLGAYNTLLSLAGNFAFVIGQLGIDMARMPPGELFADGLQGGSFALRLPEGGVSFTAENLLASQGGVMLGAVVVGVAAITVRQGIEERVTVARVTTTRALMSLMKGRLDTYRLLHSHYPEHLADLLEPDEKNLGDPHAENEEDLLDSWGQPFLYERKSSRSYKLVSLGADGEPGGEGEDADIDGGSR